MHEMEEKVKKLGELKEKLVRFTEEELSKEKECIYTEELGQVIDMIKDLADAEKNCWKACYYKSVVKAMKEVKEEEELMMKLDGGQRFGYNPNRYADGRYAPQGHGNYTSGYNGNPMWMGDIQEMEHMIPFGYSPNQNGQNGRDDQNGYGYTPSGQGNRSQSGSRMGYSEMNPGMDDRYGRAYNQYKEARRHYTETHSPAEKEKMKEHVKEHLSDTMTSVTEMYEGSDPEIKEKIRQDMIKLVEAMK